MDGLRIPLLLLSGVFIGYTLEPVPHWLMIYFRTSNLFKFLILVIAGLTAFEPYLLNPSNIGIVIFSAAGLIILFDYFHRIEESKVVGISLD